MLYDVQNMFIDCQMMDIVAGRPAELTPKRPTTAGATAWSLLLKAQLHAVLY
jgi:hypothetical protein